MSLSLTAVLALQQQAPGPIERANDGDTLVEACGEDPGSACEWVFERTDSELLAKTTDFLVARPLKVVLILLVAYLLNRIVRRLIKRFAGRVAGAAESGRLDRMRARTPSLLVTTEQPSLRSAARAQTIGLVLRSLSTFVIYSFALMYVMAAVGLQLGPLIAGAGIAGVALGFGAQSLVRDFLSGLFILMEDQFGVGDVIDVGPATGTVEVVSLRVTRLRDANGTVWHVPNGEIRRVGNQSQQWARAVVDLGVPFGADLGPAQAAIQRVAEAVCADPAFTPDVLEPPTLRIESLGPESVTIRVVVKTRPGAQFRINPVLRERIAAALVEQGITQVAPAT